MTEPANNPIVTQWLQERGYSPPEISLILTRLAEYESKTQSDAVFDSIGNDSHTLDAIIRDALGDRK
jgi:hypothetical protein